MPTYSMNDALHIIHQLEPAVRTPFNYCTALGGSVLHTLESKKDIDILLMPIEDSAANLEEALKMYLTLEYFAHPALIEKENSYGPSKTREVWKGNYKGIPIDFFIYKRIL